jgi:hypothetical protein
MAADFSEKQSNCGGGQNIASPPVIMNRCVAIIKVNNCNWLKASKIEKR